MPQLHHVAISVADFDSYVNLFLTLGMTVQKTRGEAPNRQLWFAEGLQINEQSTGGDCIDHIALASDSREALRGTALDNGCRELPGKDTWFTLPNGIRMELMESEK